ncbi:MAG: aminodeoxychorismate/anthranilate synthase component II [Flavobacteriales bacterium]|nr:aminodeoxychorismate/anthranilate synthase component II [Flavobacteriales bacterium]MBK6946205.1 aminodeoxychorismate/anthranilate synthase component II [Flavobacteriales bacterium]MBK7238842.1 aminodeoxychorismate/anthranilate synthase component II [Flavobacteriales bacterium]MBK7297585.1 aminodeoxychorismate/anthranilate synthase component II [Flavobacteriales bacterium]MBK9537033.1 aminodeoxychorismate/anthranilate synthase component II [Flavobacteriales bacterium]
MRLLLLDNYDSFTWNLHHLLEPFAQVDVVRNDAITVNEASQYDRIVLSPGPGLPNEAGIMMELLDKLMPSHSILGVCLGMQGIAEQCGGTLYNQQRVMHGVAVNCEVIDPTDALFEGMPSQFEVGLYHSWAVDPIVLPGALRVTAKSNSGVVMALRHVQYDTCGVQFHPESVLTPNGDRMIENWVKSSGKK